MIKLKLKLNEPLATAFQQMAREANLEVEKLAEVALGSVVAGWVQDRLNGQGVLDSSGTYPLLPGNGDSTGS